MIVEDVRPSVGGVYTSVVAGRPTATSSYTARAEMRMTSRLREYQLRTALALGGTALPARNEWRGVQADDDATPLPRYTVPRTHIMGFVGAWVRRTNCG
jgi:hypothetical protein